MQPLASIPPHVRDCRRRLRLSFRYAPPPGSLRYGGSQLPPPGRCPVCVLLGKTFFQNWGDAATAGAPGSLWFGSFAPLDAQTRSLYVLSHPPGEPESFSRLLAYPCLLGTCKTRPETAGVLLCMCWLSSPFRAAQNPTKNACKLLAFGPARSYRPTWKPVVTFHPFRIPKKHLRREHGHLPRN